MKNNTINIILAFSIIALFIMTFKYFDSMNEIKRLENSLNDERTKEVITDKTEEFINALYQGNGSMYLSKDALERYSNYEVNPTGEKPLVTDKTFSIHVTNTTFKNNKYQSNAIYDLNETIDEKPYSTTTLMVTIDWVYEDGTYKVDFYQFNLINSVLEEFAS